MILVVDDSAQDQELIREAFRELGVPASLREAHSVDEGISAFEKAQRPPDLVLLDIQMPGKDGFELLRWLRARGEGWHRVPVIMLTTSHDFVEIRRAYDLGANSFLVKPTGFDALVEMLGQVRSYWLERNRTA